jgi:predicted nucleotidyltransferase component of viral defense system
MLDRLKHEIVMKKLLVNLVRDPILASSLVFKGGTCLYLFHGLDRFSVDLDFNSLKKDLAQENITSVITRYLNIELSINKKYTYLWVGSYEKSQQKIKIEINKRSYPNTYETHDFYGYMIRTLSRESMFAHKLCAITDRKSVQNRDIYDSWYMFKHDFRIQEEIIKLRTGMDTQNYLSFLIKYIEKEVKRDTILQGLGELLDNKRKDWVKRHLLDELIFELKLHSSI